jgi:pyruvate dehydrogenase E2 component (dihydrolipoamide acetyltransferase)
MFEFHLPDIGEGVVEGEIVAWKVKEGDVVALDQPMVEVMTDKATVEIPAPRAGRIAKINYTDGQICPVGQVLVVIDDASGAKAAPSSGNGKSQPKPPGPEASSVPTSGPVPTPVPTPVRTELTEPHGTRTRVLATPATRRLARQMNVDLGRVPASGRNGRVTTDDLKRFAQQPVSIARGGPEVGTDEERIPLRGIRKKIAETMTRSVHTAAHFTYVEEVDVTELVAVRERARARAFERGIKLTYLPFIVKAVVSGLRRWPMLNASLDEATQEIVRKKYYHIGIAAQGPHGLTVSVLRDADKRSLFDVAKEIERLGEAVRNGTATRDDLVGSTFTISSLGKLGGLHATPIINFPEVAIVGVHKIEERPAVRDGQIVARWLMNLSISVDHRLADGYDGAMFLQDVKTLLEDPTTMFMEMV